MRHFVAFSCVLIFSALAVAGDASSSAKSVIPAASSKATQVEPPDQGRFAFGVNASLLLGYGAEVAARVTHHSNVRAGFNILPYSHTFDKDGTTYSGHLEVRSVEVHYDYFPWARHGFHISPGMLAFIGDPVSASAVLGPNQSITLGGTDYTSDPANPAHLYGKMKFRQVSPMLTFGFRNIVPHNSRHFTIFPIDIGVAFTGSPKTTLTATGNLCDSSGTCQPASNASVQNSIVGEQNKIDHSLRAFKIYPIVSSGFTYKF